MSWEMFSRGSPLGKSFVKLLNHGVDIKRCSFSRDKIMEMQCDLLISNFRNPATITLMQENIGRISDGPSSHHASPLKLGFKKAL